MRKWNGILTAVILALFLLHGILGGFQLLGVGSTALKTIAWGNVGLILIHTVIGLRLTAHTLKVWKRTGVSYFKENKLFWARRISGFAIMALLVFHRIAFSSTGTGGGYRLPWFTGARLAAQILLVAAIALHVITNVRPMLITFGIRSLRRWMGDVLLVLAVLLLFMAGAFIVYYLRWNVF